MNGYKRFIPKKIRFEILRLLRFVPDRKMLKIQYRIKLHRPLNLENPQRYTEKIQWLKLHYHNPILPICVDKYRVREFLRSRGLDSITVKLYAVEDNVNDLNWDNLPQKFILKTTNGSGTNIICRDKNSLNISEVKNKINHYLKQSSASAGREWPYALVKPKIIVEELLIDPSSSDGIPSDYKILCFNGSPNYIVFDTDRYTFHRRNIYDTEWNNLHVDSDCPQIDREVPKPKNLERMINIARTLAEGFPSVRIDLYNIEGKIYFGEMTFFPWSGYVRFQPDDFDYEMGKRLVISRIPGGGKYTLAGMPSAA